MAVPRRARGAAVAWQRGPGGLVRGTEKLRGPPVSRGSLLRGFLAGADPGGFHRIGLGNPRACTALTALERRPARRRGGGRQSSPRSLLALPQGPAILAALVVERCFLEVEIKGVKSRTLSFTRGRRERRGSEGRVGAARASSGRGWPPSWPSRVSAPAPACCLGRIQARARRRACLNWR